MKVTAYAAQEAKGKLAPYEYELGPIGYDEVDIDVLFCGICHSDMSMLHNDWGMTKYPFVPGHEVVGTVKALGAGVNNLEVGQTVGLGWTARSCLECDQCMSGDHNLCRRSQGTIVGRHGGFADIVRAQSTWVIPLPDDVDAESAGPLFCGGITVFNPIIQSNVNPLDRVGVVGIGGLGHMALAFSKAWGCEVTAFSTSPEKEAEARSLGAPHFVSTHDLDALKAKSNYFDFILDTVNVELAWDAYVRMLKPKGILHIVGAAPKVTASIFPLMGGQKSITASPTGSPYYIGEMLEFAGRHNINPMIEKYKMSEVNEALEKLENGKPRYRIVLEVDK